MTTFAPRVVIQLSLPRLSVCRYDADGCHRLVLEMLRRVMLEARWANGTHTHATVAQAYIGGRDFALWASLIGLDVEVVRREIGKIAQKAGNGATIDLGAEDD